MIRPYLIVGAFLCSLSMLLNAAPPGGKNWETVFSEDFNGSALNTSNFGQGFGWGAKSGAFYEATRPQNVAIADGLATLKAEKEGSNYWSGAINTRNKFYQRFGYWEARVKVPSHRTGILPAFWMKLNNDIWPPELDIFEFFGAYGAGKVAQTVHYSDPGHKDSGIQVNLGDMSKDFHLYGMEWTENYVKWYVDGVVTRTVDKSTHPKFMEQWNGGDPNGAYIMLNIHMGAGWLDGGQVTSDLPCYMQIDYVRAYKESSVPVTTPPSITTQPANKTAAIGQSVTFSVGAAGGQPLAYQWKRNGSNIAGATTSSYTIQSVSTNDNGARFTVAVSNPYGSVTSNEAVLTVSEWDGIMYAKDFPYQQSTCYAFESATGALHVPFDRAGQSCQISKPFPGASGTYAVKLRLLTEGDGRPYYKVFIRSAQVGSTYQAPLQAQTELSVSLSSSAPINKGDTVTVWSQNDADAWGRWTAVEFTLLQPTDVKSGLLSRPESAPITVRNGVVHLSQLGTVSVSIIDIAGRAVCSGRTSGQGVLSLSRRLEPGRYILRSGSMTRQFAVR